MTIDYSLDFWGIILPAVVVMIILAVTIIALLIDGKKLWYVLTRKWRTRHGRLKYILYDPKRDIFVCKNCGGFISREQYLKTEEEPSVCPTCGQRLMRVWFC